MPIYRAPVEDYKFLLHELFEIERQTDLPRFDALSPDLIDDILSNAGRFCEEKLQPLNRSGDEEGCRFENGVVRTPKGFREAYRAWREAGWGAIAAPAEVGGAGLPAVLAMAVQEMAMSANQAFALYPELTGAAWNALYAAGAPWMKEHIVPKLVSGEWTGTMCLTEAHCGTDLRLMKTRAVERPNGSYRMTGTKIFITGGDHDLADNIVHMVIAKIPNENGAIRDDLSTVNFFMVPKYLVGEDGGMGARNGISCGGIEHKMGIKGSATCVLNFDNAVAWRLGPKPAPLKPGETRKASAGMAGMFAMMNAARLAVGMQGVAIGEVAFQNGLEYARTRRVGRAFGAVREPGAPADFEIAHPDVRRMLLHIRAYVEGARAVGVWTSLNMAIGKSARPEKDSAALLADLMTPVIKAFFTDMGFEAANLAMQCYGGHGYIRENGIEQFVRDGRIAQIYEGANGIQALDLVGRKLARNGGEAPLTLFDLIGKWLRDNDSEEMAPFVKPVQRGLESLQRATGWLAQNGVRNPNDAAAGACDYLRLMGIVVTGWMWARMAKLATDNSPFYRGKLICARYWMERLMPECPMLLERIEAGSATLMEFK